ncbi:EF hand domain containing protein [Balamuthia mandrillaris]
MGNGSSSQRQTPEEFAASTGLSAGEVSALLDAFRAAGNKHDKAIDRKHFKKVVAEVHARHPNDALSPESADLAFTTFDVNGNGKVDPFELLGGIAIICNGTIEEKAELTFKAIDKNNDGNITKSELEDYIHKVVTAAGEAVKAEKRKEGLGFAHRVGLKVAIRVVKEKTKAHLVAEAFKADTDGDGKLDLEEFKAAARAGNEAIVGFLNPRHFMEETKSSLG